MYPFDNRIEQPVAVVICFFLCWAPFHAQRLIAVYGPGVIADGGGSSAHGSDIKGDINDADVELLNGIPTIGDADDVRDSLKSSSNTNNNSNNNKDHHEVIYTVMTYISGVLYYLSTCINPLLYNLMSNKFRQAFKVNRKITDSAGLSTNYFPISICLKKTSNFFL